MGSLARMVLDDPESFNLLTDDMKEKIVIAATNMVNIQSAMLRKRAIVNIQKNFTLRNDFTLKQIQFSKMPLGGKSLSDVQASIGATEKAAFMKRQELGGRHEPLKGKNLAIPTLHARGGSMGAMVQKQFRVSNLADLKVRGPYSKKHKFGEKDKRGAPKSAGVARAAVAFRERKLIHYGSKLFFVDNFVARGGEVSFSKRQLYSFDKPFTVTQASPWMSPEVDNVAAEGPGIFASQMKKVGL